jgi:hypothetical protein
LETFNAVCGFEIMAPPGRAAHHGFSVSVEPKTA